ncbi:MAG: GFA family protein [Paracoccus sp. (in: a-proteobacteria)]
MTCAVTGSCLCGACQLNAEPGNHAGICHCQMCRKWTGGNFIGVKSESPVTFNEEAPLGIYRSSEWGERVFCQACGSSLVWRTRDGQQQVVSIQVFDDPSRFPVVSEIFIDRKPDGYNFAGTHETMTEAEVMAQYAPKEEG